MRAGVERAGRDNVFDVGIGGMGFFKWEIIFYWVSIDLVNGDNSSLV